MRQQGRDMENQDLIPMFCRKFFVSTACRHEEMLTICSFDCPNGRTSGGNNPDDRSLSHPFCCHVNVDNCQQAVPCVPSFRHVIAASHGTVSVFQATWAQNRTVWGVFHIGRIAILLSSIWISALCRSFARYIKVPAIMRHSYSRDSVAAGYVYGVV